MEESEIIVYRAGDTLPLKFAQAKTVVDAWRSTFTSGIYETVRKDEEKTECPVEVP